MVRLRAPDGYTAQRAYSIASDPDDDELELLVERFEDGEVSTFLADDAEVGDELELRGPLGGWFTWDLVTPAVCLVGGTGVVPAISMLRAAARAGVTDRIRVLAVGRSPVELPYADELRERGGTLAFTRHALPDRPAGPPTAAEVAAAADGASHRFRLRLSAFRDPGDRTAGGGRLPGREHPDRAVRTHRLGRGVAAAGRP